VPSAAPAPSSTPTVNAPVTIPEAVLAGMTFTTAPPLFGEEPEGAAPESVPGVAVQPAPEAGLIGEDPTSTFQLVLYADGRIQFGYDGAYLRDAIVGMTPGGDGGGSPEAAGVPANEQAYDFSSEPAIAVDANTAPYEAFYGFPDSPFDLDHTFLAFDPDGAAGYTGIVQVPTPEAPTVEVVSPQVGDLLIEGQWINVLADANDDVLVAQVVFTIDGNVYEPIVEPPYEVGYELPLGATSVTIQVTATDNQGLTATTSVTLGVSPDPVPTVTLTAPPAGTTLVEGETLTIAAEADDNVAVTGVDLSVQTLSLPSDSQWPYARTFRVPTGVSSLSVTAVSSDNLGQVSVPSTETYAVVSDPLTTVRGTVLGANDVPVPGATVELVLHGLKAEYFHLDEAQSGIPDLTGLTPAATRLVSSLDFRNPGNLFGNDTFGIGRTTNLAARFTSTLSVQSGGTYVFTLGANDGARLRVDGTTLAETVSTAYAETTATTGLTAGNHTLEVIYFQNEGDAELQLSWQRPGQERDAIGSGSFAQPTVTVTGVTDGSGVFTLADAPTHLGGVRVKASATVSGELRRGESGEVQPVRGGTTELGNIRLQSGVLIVAADSNPPTSQLLATGQFTRVDFFNAASSTPTLQALQAYPVVLVYTNNTPANATALGNVLADYVDGGGAVVLATYSFSTPWSVQGRITTYSPLVNVGLNGTPSGLLVATVPGDPVFAGVNLSAVTYFRNSNFARPNVSAEATLLATDGSGRNMIARSTTRAVMGVNLYPGTGVSGNNAEFYKLLAKTITTVR
jgi:hypothetical protein